MYIFFSSACWPLRKLCNAFALLLHPTFETSVIFIFFFLQKNSVCHPTFDLAPEVIQASGEVNKESRLIAEEWNEKQ